MEAQINKRIKNLEERLVELEKEWDRLDNMGSMSGLQTSIAREMESIRKEIENLKWLKNFSKE